MNLPRRQFLHLAAGAAALPAASRVARAQAYPTRPVRIIVAYAPGGQTDTIARLLAQKLSDRFGTQFYVENVPGAGGNIGMARAAQAAPDGYTLAVIDVTASVVNPRLTKVAYDPFKDFDPIALPATTTQVLVVHPSLPVRTVTELVALVRANPGRYSYGSAGIGSASHLTAELFRTSLGLDLIHVPFNGALQRAWEEALANFGVRVSEFVRIGLTREQVDDLDSARLREGIAVKPSDSRAERYIEQYGERCWETDILPAAVIEQALDNHVRSWLDGKLWQRRAAEIERARVLL